MIAATVRLLPASRSVAPRVTVTLANSPPTATFVRTVVATAPPLLEVEEEEPLMVRSCLVTLPPTPLPCHNPQPHT